MSLINCPECESQISAAAETCVQCGHPIHGRNSAGDDQQKLDVQTIEATGKPHKLTQLAGAGLAVAGGIGMTQDPIWGLLMAAGAVLFLVGSFTGWFQHG